MIKHARYTARDMAKLFVRAVISSPVGDSENETEKW